MIKDLSLIIKEFKKDTTESLRNRIAKCAEYVGKGVYNFTGDMTKAAVISSLLYGAFYFGRIYERENYVPEIVEITEKGVFIDYNKISDLFFNEKLSEKNKVVFTNREYNERKKE